ncbi:MAG: hypothetical protein EXR95_01105 [Gemmatimonadetes bacterium]|nr:hypothetical protein [Gemmatimonadota bacterium]
MKVERIRIQAFGRLHDFDSGKEPLGDLVVVLGPNEAGKTTLFHFLATALYGFSPASRESHPYAPWSGAEAAGIALLRLADGTSVEVHRRLLSSPTGTLVRAGRTEELRNKPVPAAEHVPAAVFEQVYAISLSELSGLAGESWERIQDRLVTGLGANDLRPARIVADELDEEAGELWRPNRRGNQRLRQLRERLRDLDARRRDVVDSDRTLRDKVRELDRTRTELESARAERETFQIYVERFNKLLPVRAALLRVRALQQEAGRTDDFAGLPADPVARLEELDEHADEQAARVAELARDADAPRRRAEVLGAADLKLIERRGEVERVTARVTAAGWMRARAGQLEQELLEIAGRVENESAELFEVPWERVDADRVRAIPAVQMRTRARDLEETRARIEAQREAARQLAEAEARRASEGSAIGRWAAWVVALTGVGFMIGGVVTGRRTLALVGALLLGAGGTVLATAMARGRRQVPTPSPSPAGPMDRREIEVLGALVDLLGGLPVREALLKRNPGQLVTGIERIQQLLRERQGRELEATRLRSDTAVLIEEVAQLAAACATEIPPDPVAAAHLLAAAAVEAGRRQASVERATEELGRIKRTRVREEEGLARMRAEAAALRGRIAAFADGDEREGLRRLRARREAAAQATRVLAELERAHPDLDALRARVREAEAAGEDWVDDEEALARRKVRLPEMARRVEALARTEASLEQEIHHLAAGETLDRIDGEVEVLQEDMRRLEHDRDRRHVLARLVREADRRFREEHQPELVRRAGEHLDAITGGRYTRVLLADGTGELAFRVRSDDAPQPLPVEAPLSTGTREQVYLALRLAAVDQLDRDGERLPLFLDETLVNWDPQRLDRGLGLLGRIARARQVFVFTCHPEAAERLRAQGALVIRLEAPR